MRDPQGIIVRPLMTEKNMDRVQKRSVYSFEVVEDANIICTRPPTKSGITCGSVL